MRPNWRSIMKNEWAGQCGRYNDCLRAGRSGDRNLAGARFSAPVQTGPEAHPASCTMGTRSFPGVRCGRGVTLTPHPLLVPRSKIEQSYTSTLPKGLCGLRKGETYLIKNEPVTDGVMEGLWIKQTKLCKLKMKKPASNHCLNLVIVSQVEFVSQIQ